MMPDSFRRVHTSVADNVAEDIRHRIECGEYRPGSLLPGRRELIGAYKVAPRTLQQAVNILVSAGRLRTENGVGTFVIGDVETDNSKVEPDRAARPRNPQADKPLLIGFISVLSSRENDFVEEKIALRSVERAASTNSNVSLRYHNILLEDGRKTSMRLAAEALLAQGAHGVIATAPLANDREKSEVDRCISLLEDAGVPLVMCGRLPNRSDVCQVVYDNVAAGSQAVRHLLQRGWRKFAFVAPLDLDWVPERIAGAKQALANLSDLAGISLAVVPETPYLIMSGVNAAIEKQGYDIGKEILVRANSDLGIIACNDYTAYGILKAASELKRRPGIDFGIIGFDDYFQSRSLNLSTVRMPYDQMGAESFNILLRSINGVETPQLLSLRAEVVSRSSSTHLLGFSRSINSRPAAGALF
jgi:DNA-binding LacI/PurR family transcriptional regulator